MFVEARILQKMRDWMILQKEFGEEWILTEQLKILNKVHRAEGISLGSIATKEQPSQKRAPSFLTAQPLVPLPFLKKQLLPQLQPSTLLLWRTLKNSFLFQWMFSQKNGHPYGVRRWRSAQSSDVRWRSSWGR